MSWDVSRRVFLRGAGLAAVGMGMAPSLAARAHGARRRARQGAGAGVPAAAASTGSTSAVPYGDSEYYNLRGGIGLPRPGQAGGVVNLDGTSGCTPSLAPLEPLFGDGRLAFIQPSATPG